MSLPEQIKKDHHGNEIPLVPTRLKSKNQNKPDSGQWCEVSHGRVNRPTAGQILYYFDDENGIEHARIDIGGYYIIRRSDDIYDDASKLIK